MLKYPHKINQVRMYLPRTFLVGQWIGNCLPVDRNLPASARGTGLIPGPGRFHIPWSNEAPCATTTEVLLPTAHAP